MTFDKILPKEKL